MNHMQLFLLSGTNINFPKLNINLKNVPDGFDVFGFHITLYGICIGLGMLCGWLIAEWMAKRTGQKPEFYLDFALVAIVVSVIFTRLFYVLFSLDEFKDDPLQIFNLRNGGLMIYGGIFGAVLTAFLYTRIKKYSFWLLADTGCIGLVTGQIIGRWGNFFNREVFGKYTNSIFAMQLDRTVVPGDYRMAEHLLREKYAGKETLINRIIEIRNNIKTIDGVEYIQVHPTFLYESLWNLGLLIFLVFYTKRKKFDGEVMLLYMGGYGLGRFWIEGMRTDQLFLWGTPIPISQLIAALIFTTCVAMILIKRRKIAKAKAK